MKETEATATPQYKGSNNIVKPSIHITNGGNNSEKENHPNCDKSAGNMTRRSVLGIKANLILGGVLARFGFRPSLAKCEDAPSGHSVAAQSVLKWLADEGFDASLTTTLAEMHDQGFDYEDAVHLALHLAEIVPSPPFVPWTTEWTMLSTESSLDEWLQTETMQKWWGRVKRPVV